jgi:hypothetical protein
MAYLSNTILDLALNGIDTLVTAIHITETEATTYAEATTTHDGGANKYSLGSHTDTDLVGAATDDGTAGRKVVIRAIIAADAASVTATGNAAFWALVTADALIATGAITTPQDVTVGNTWTLATFDINVNDAT